MKTIAIIMLLCLPVIANEEDKQALRELRLIYQDAIADRDLSLLKPHLADDFSAVMVTAHEINGFGGITEYWSLAENFLGEGGTYTVSIDPDETLFEGDLAIAKGRPIERVTRKNGKPLEMMSYWTAIARKVDGDWKLVRIQATLDPVDNPIIKSLQAFRNLLIGGVCLAVGGIIGFLAPRRRKRA